MEFEVTIKLKLDSGKDGEVSVTDVKKMVTEWLPDFPEIATLDSVELVVVEVAEL